MDRLNALADAWPETKEPSVSELLAARCRQCRVSVLLPMHVRAKQQQQNQPVVVPVTEPSAATAALSSLTQREIQVATLVALGHDNDAVAKRLFLATHTIKSHKARIFRKLGIDTSVQLAVLVAKAGLV
jgi:DNA-binding NarL/FixJ family response regulator